MVAEVRAHAREGTEEAREEGEEVLPGAQTGPEVATKSPTRAESLERSKTSSRE